MKAIDSGKVAEKTYKCGKKLKVGQIAQEFNGAWDDLEKDNPTYKEVKEKLGKDLFEELYQTTITYFALRLLARTHNSKELNKILDECEVGESEDA